MKLSVKLVSQLNKSVKRVLLVLVRKITTFKYSFIYKNALIVGAWFYQFLKYVAVKLDVTEVELL